MARRPLGRGSADPWSEDAGVPPDTGPDRVSRPPDRGPHFRASGDNLGKIPERVVNAWWGLDRLHYVVRDPNSRNGVRTRRLRAEHSTFVAASDLDPSQLRALRGHPLVVGLNEEGDYIRIKFDTRDDCWSFCTAIEKAGGTTYEGAVSPVLRWMVDNGIGVDEPRMLWFDFESDSRVPFSRKEEMRILSWAAEDAQGRTFNSLLNEDSDRDERRVLGELWEVIDDYDLIMAWNGDRFDFPLLKARSDYRGLMMKRDWRRWLWLDHLIVFSKMNMMAAESGEEKQSFKLDSIAHAVLGEGKHEFDSSKTWEAWAAGGERRRELLSYNKRDVTLMPRLEEKTGYIRLLRTIGDVCGTFADSRGANPSVQVEGYLQRLGHERGHKFPTVRRQPFDRYKGAFVLHPKEKGILRDVHVADFSRLYPSIIMSWNISPDTFIGMEGDDSVIEAQNLGVDMSRSPLTGAHFETTKQGILPAAVAEMIGLRSSWDKKKSAATPGTSQWKEADRRSSAYKITANQFYGVVGSSTSRFFKREAAEAVSQCGAWLITQTIEAAEDRGMRVVYGDTDSLFVTGASREEFEEFVEWCNEVLYPRLLASEGCRENFIKLAYEKQFDRLVFTTAKRYVGSYAHYKGSAATADSKPEIKGLEFKRGDSTKIARDLQEVVAHRLVGYKCEVSDDPEDFVQILSDWRRRILIDELTLDDVMISKTLTRPLDGYVRRTKKTGGFARQPPHVEVARILEQRGRDVGEGAKIDYFILDGSAKPAVTAPAEDWDGECNRESLWEATAKPTIRLVEAAFPNYSWRSMATVGSKKNGRGRRAL